MLLACCGLATGASAQPEALTGPAGRIIAPPASVDQDPPVSTCAAGKTNTQQEGFDEAQGVVLGSPIEIDPGGYFLDGITVDSHMIFLQSGGMSVSETVTWCFDGLIVGVMSDQNGVLEAASNGVLGGTPCYPGGFTYRGLETTLGDGYTVHGSSITVTMNVTSPGDWIRVVTDPAESSGVTFSLDHGPTLGLADAWHGDVIETGDILTVGTSSTLRLNDLMTGAPLPGVLIDESGLGLNGMNVDALSFGNDDGDTWVFSVTEGAIGCPGIPMVCVGPSDVWLEGYCPCASVGPVCLGAPGTCSAAGQVFAFTPGGGNVLRHVQSEFGIVNAPPGAPPQDDDIDAMDLDTTSDDVSGRIFFSLDSTSAASLGFSGADILMIDPCQGPTPQVYASYAALNLANDDDVDALALVDDGDGVYTPGVDQIFFSVRATSTVVGQIECNPAMFTATITGGDILRPGMCAVNPKIHIPHNVLGLFVNPPDDIDALDRISDDPECYADCDGNGMLDLFDFLCFVNAFTSGDPYADCDENGSFDLFDFLCYSNAFNAGCP